MYVSNNNKETNGIDIHGKGPIGKQGRILLKLKHKDGVKT